MPIPPPPIPPDDDPLWRLAQPLVIAALDGFSLSGELNFTTTSSTLLVASRNSFALQVAADRMSPVFKGAGWSYLSEFRGNFYRRLAFTLPPSAPPPSSPQTVARSNLHVVR